MKYFRLNQRVRVTDTTTCLSGYVGTVSRPCNDSCSAWIQMDKTLPEDMQGFHPDDFTRVQRDVLLFPFQCTVLP